MKKRQEIQSPYLTYYIIIASLLLLASCSGSKEKQFIHEAEALIDVYPDRAYQLLQDINPQSLPSGSELQARYALLYTHGGYKEGEDATSDSLITVAADYYERHGNGAVKFHAYLYQGITRYHLSDYDNATVSLLKALAHIGDAGGRYNRGLLYTYLALVNGAQHCADEVMYASKAYYEYRTGEYPQYSASALTVWGVAMMHVEDYDSCRLLLDASIHEAERLHNDFLLQEALSAKAEYAIQVDSIDMAKEQYQRLNTLADYQMTAQDMGNLAIIYAIESKADSARECLTRARQLRKSLNDDISYCTTSFWMNRYLGNEEEAHAWKDSILEYEGQLLSEALRNKSLSSLKEYTQWQLDEAERNNTIKNLWLIGLLCCIALLSLSFYAFYRKQQLQVELQAQKIKNLQMKLAHDAAEHSDGLRQMLSHKLVEDLQQMAVRKDVPHIDWPALDDLFASQLPHFGKSLRELTPLSEVEWRVCLLLKLGFTPSGIAQLVSRSPEAVSSVRRRLYAKVFQKKGTPSDWDAFIDSL